MVPGPSVRQEEALGDSAGEVGAPGALLGLWSPPPEARPSQGDRGTGKLPLLMAPFPPWGTEKLCARHGLHGNLSHLPLCCAERQAVTEHLGAHRRPYGNNPTGSGGLTFALSGLSEQQQQPAFRGKCLSTACPLHAALPELVRKGAAGARAWQRGGVHVAWLQTHWRAIFICISCCRVGTAPDLPKILECQT